MRVNHRADVVAMLVDSKMHAELAGDLPRSLELSALKIDDDHVGGRQQKLAEASGSNQQALLVQSNGKIS